MYTEAQKTQQRMQSVAKNKARGIIILDSKVHSGATVTSDTR